jgi:hypothetical protein
MGGTFHGKHRPATARPRCRGPCRALIVAGLCLMLLGCAAPAGDGSSFGGPYGGITGGAGGTEGR